MTSWVAQNCGADASAAVLGPPAGVEPQEWRLLHAKVAADLARHYGGDMVRFCAEATQQLAKSH